MRSRPYLLLALALALALNACGKAVPPGPDVGESLGSSEIAPQRVTAAIERYAAELVHVQTERGTLVTTPEHPFAKSGWGWVAARELRPRDRVLSARFGTVGVTSVRTEKLTEPVAVFNFTVDRSHAYLVGNDEVLVHNADCQPESPPTLQQMLTRLEEAERQLRALKDDNPKSPEEREQNKKRIAELKGEISRLKYTITNARNREYRATHGMEEPGLRDAEARLESTTQRLADLHERIRLDRAQGGIEGPELLRQLKDLKQLHASTALDVRQLREIQGLVEARSKEKNPVAHKALTGAIRKLRNLVYKRRYDRSSGRIRDRAESRAQKALNQGLASADPEVREVLSGELPATEYNSLLKNLDNELQNDPSAPVNEPLLEGMVSEFLRELEGAQGQLQVELQRDTAAVDDLSEDLVAQLRTPSPEQLPQVRESIIRLHDQLAEERAQFEMNYVVLGRQEAFLEAVLQQGGSSQAPANLQSVRERRAWLREDWQQRMQNRVAEARGHLRDMQSSTALRNEEIEAELAEHISILGDELANPPF